ncbi:MAG: L-histidine N(alpha)-methyltransferase [Rhodospirillaceae bacterium]
MVKSSNLMNIAFLHDVLSGLSQKQKRLAPKYFYDAHGSALFDSICELDEYYPTRTEMKVLEDRAKEITDLIYGYHLIEFGSGSSAKIRILLNAASQLASYVPVDISRDHLFAAANKIANDYPDLSVSPICADFTQDFELPDFISHGKKAVFFPGSTIGNFSRIEAEQFLSMLAEILGNEGGLVIGVDLKKDPNILNAAYNDSKGVTAAFNLNLLVRINRELNANFDLSAFEHKAHYNASKGRIEMHLLSKAEQTVIVGGREFHFNRHETIHTENSHKYDIDEFHEMGRQAGFKPEKTWTDSNKLFSIHYLRVAA